MSLKQCAQAWNGFFHDPVPPTAISLYRIVFGITMLAYGALTAPDLYHFLGDRGVLSWDFYRTTAVLPHICVFDVLRGDGWVAAVFWTFAAASLCLTLGLWTRASSVVVFVALISMHNRNPYILNGGDHLLRCAAFLLMFSPAGAVLSLDRWWQARRGRSETPAGSPWAQRLLQIQLSLAYLSTASLKAQGYAWVNGTAVYYTSRLWEFARFPVPYVFEHMWTIKLITCCVLALEFALAVLIWFVELRYLVLALGLALHLSLEYTMNLPLIEWAFLGLYVLWVDPKDLDRLLRAISSARCSAGRYFEPSRTVSPDTSERCRERKS